ncbi:hypothetical protein AAHH78_41305, partial [Burkholderia pseudomallei]
RDVPHLVGDLQRLADPLQFVFLLFYLVDRLRMLVVLLLLHLVRGDAGDLPLILHAVHAVLERVVAIGQRFVFVGHVLA